MDLFLSQVFKSNNSSKRQRFLKLDPYFHSEPRHTTHKIQAIISVQPNVPL